MGDATASDSRGKERGMFSSLKTRLMVVGGTAAMALAAVATAGATGPTVPTVDPSAYGDTLLSNVGTQLSAVLPYAAAFTAFAIGVGFIKGWIGRRKATSVSR
jgi:hypothetical protein